jgi:hypothetical protein
MEIKLNSQQIIEETIYKIAVSLFYSEPVAPFIHDILV